MKKIVVIAAAMLMAAPVGSVLARDGKQVFDSFCHACHLPPGIPDSPKLGDKAAWAPRIAQGMDTLFSHVQSGFKGPTGMVPMPPKGTCMDCTDDGSSRRLSSTWSTPPSKSRRHPSRPSRPGCDGLPHPLQRIEQQVPA